MLNSNREFCQIAVVGSADLELLVDIPAMPRPGERAVGENFRIRPAGRAAEVAASLGNIGARVFFFSALGLDPFGVRILTDLRRHRVNVDFVERLRDISTGIIHRFATPDGETRGVHTPGSAMHMTEKGLRLGKVMISACDLVILYPDIPRPAFNFALSLANHFRVPVLVDPTPADRVPRESLERIDILTPNRAEAETLLNMKITGMADALEAGRRLTKFGPAAVALTLGKLGAVAATDLKRSVYLPAPVAKTQPERRPGDVFTTVLAAKLAAKSDFVEACHTALAISAHADYPPDGSPPDLHAAHALLRPPLQQ